MPTTTELLTIEDEDITTYDEDIDEALAIEASFEEWKAGYSKPYQDLGLISNYFVL